MRSPPPLDGMFDGRGISYLTGFVSAVAAILTGWIYSCILPSRQTIVVDTAQGFFNLLFAAWYIVMGIVSRLFLSVANTYQYVPTTDTLH